jgi:hypothetical protein
VLAVVEGNGLHGLDEGGYWFSEMGGCEWGNRKMVSGGLGRKKRESLEERGGRLGRDRVFGLGLGLWFILFFFLFFQNCSPLSVLRGPVFIGKNIARFPNLVPQLLSFFKLDFQCFFAIFGFFRKFTETWVKN